MYNRKIKLLGGGGKKKSKAPSTIGSSWGPRIALYEREKKLSHQGDAPPHINITSQSLPQPNLSQQQVHRQNPNVYTTSSVGEIYSSKDLQVLHQQEQYHHQNLRNNPGRGDQKHYPKKVSTSSSSLDGSTSCANHYIYNYARKASTSASSGTNKSFPVSSSSSTSHFSNGNSSNKSSNINNNIINSNVGGGSTYILGSNSGSQITLSGPTTFGDTLSQPLTLIIPPQDKLSGFESEFDESSRYVGLDRSQDSFPSTRTYRSSDEDDNDDDDDDDEDGDDDDQVIYNDSHHDRSSKGERLASRRKSGELLSRNKKQRQQHINQSGGIGILKVSTTRPQIHHHHQTKDDTHQPNLESPSSSNNSNFEEPQKISSPIHGNSNAGDVTENNNLNSSKGNIKKQLKSPEISDLKSKNIAPSVNSNTLGSTISSLAHGITMVYVPMESLPRSKSAAVLNASLEYDPEIISELVKEDHDDTNDGNELSPNAVLQSFPSPTKDPDNDSLLESFDSIMFKPKEAQGQSPHLTPVASIPISSINTNKVDNIGKQVDVDVKTKDDEVDKKGNEGQKVHVQKPRQLDILQHNINVPPPLPPKNPVVDAIEPQQISFSGGPKKENRIKSSLRQSQRDRNIKAAMENLENIINPKSPSKDGNIIVAKNKEKVVKTKRVTLALPDESIPRRNQELMLNLQNNSQDDYHHEVDAYCSTFLTCGHVLKDDDYSTLSSTHSISGRVSDNGDNADDEFHCFSNHNSPKGDLNKGDEGGEQRSVIQQLRELSILISGGLDVHENTDYGENDKIFTEIRNNKDNSSGPIAPTKSFRLHEEDPKRKTSDATDNSADSGKGSGSASGSSPKSIHSSPGSEKLKIQKSLTISTCPSGGSQACVFRSDCNECLLYNKPVDGFQKPCNSEELCGNAECRMNEINNAHSDPKKHSIRKSSNSSSSISNSNSNSLKRSTNNKILRRKSSRSSKSSSTKSSKLRKKKPLILDYCECSSCDAGMSMLGVVVDPMDFYNSSNIKPEIEISENVRKISSGSSSSGGSSSTKLSRSVAFRNSSRSPPKQKSSPLSIGNDNVSSVLFTIQETEESPSVESHHSQNMKNSVSNINNSTNINNNHKAPIATFNLAKHNVSKGSPNNSSEADIQVSQGSPHWHPNCWLAAADPMLGWSDLESLYSLNVKNDKPLSINGECWTCWQEISDIKRNSENPNGTVDRTKRMFIWLNKRHKEFQAPWWEAKKQASVRWVMTKALAHVPKEYLIDPFKESKKGKPTKYRLRDEVIRGLVSGKLYSLALVNLYRETLGGTGHPKNGLNHWEIIKILSRRGAYVAQPSDMKLTEGTLRQKPIRIAAHIALIEAIMSLYSKEILGRERIINTLRSFGCTVKPETTSPEKLVVAWINAAVMTLKTYIMSTRNHQLPPEKQNRWLQLPKVGEIRDLCDGVGICSLFAIYCSNDLKLSEISVPDPGEPLTIYDSITNHSVVQKLCEDLFPETIYHLCVTDFLYIHGYMKQNILCFLVDLFIHLEVNPIVRVNRLTHVPIRVEL